MNHNGITVPIGTSAETFSGKIANLINNKEELRNFKSKIDKQNKINKINVIFN